ncbi:MAG: ferritin-like domain-containing protein [bacterium]|nr:ferritin-like domain-containing protein [bacterium]
MADESSSAPENAVDYGIAAFREVTRHPKAHAHILQQYRVGEYAGVVALKRLLAEMQPEGKLHKAMEIHFRDEERHSQVFTDWIYRLGVTPEPLPAEVEGYFANSPEEFEQQRRLVEQLPPDLRRIIVFAGINAIEKIAFNQFETHLRALDRPDDVRLLESVMAEEKFHLSYVEHELERVQTGENGAFVKMALDTAKERFAVFSEMRREQSRVAIEKLLGAGG